MYIKPKNNSKSGYTLIELSISIAIIAILLTGAAGIFFKYDESKRYLVTKSNMKFIEKALSDFIDSNNHLPCPARGDLLENDGAFGYSVLVSASTDPTQAVYKNCIVTNSLGTSTNYVGMVPVRTLKIPDNYAYDGWGRKFSYSISKGMANATDVLSGNYKGDIKIIDLQGVYKTTFDKDPAKNNYGAAYILISFGQNGLGAWSKDSTASPILPSPSSREYQNVRYIVDTAPTITSRKFIQNERNYLFGHIVSYKAFPNLFDIRYQRSPLRIPNNTCSNAEVILNDPNQTYNSTVISTDILRAAKSIRKLCNNQPLSTNKSSSSCLFSPSDLSNLQVWLDAADVNNDETNIPANGTNIITWYDKSGNNRNAVKSSGNAIYRVATSTPFKKSAIFYDGAGILQTFNGSYLYDSSYTFFIVYSGSFDNTVTAPIQVIGNGFFVFSHQYIKDAPFISSPAINYTSNWLHFFGYSSGGIRDKVYVTNSEQPVVLPSNTALTAKQHLPFMAMGLFDKTTPQRILNVRSNNGFSSYGRWTGTSNVHTGAAGINIGGCSGYAVSQCSFYNGYIGEIIMYNRALSVTEQKQVEGYLLRKWFSGEC